MSAGVLVDRLALFVAMLALAVATFMSSHHAIGAERGTARAPAAMDFSGPREAWQRLAQALRRGDKDGAMKQLTPAAQERYEKSIDEWLKMKPFDEARFGRATSVTLTGAQFATVTVKRKKEDGTYSGQIMLMRGDDGRWRVDRM
ncbi:MAG TPA: hypothetical protein VFC24_03490 [Casimicrobiaceae bacterium]|nr:hypothetical protein [Casimicrobiaceae bacterium]